MTEKARGNLLDRRSGIGMHSHWAGSMDKIPGSYAPVRTGRYRSDSEYPSAALSGKQGSSLRGAAEPAMDLYYIMPAVPGFAGYAYTVIPKTRHYFPLNFITVVLVAGAFGNLIDRIRLKYVVDFVYISAIDFPVLT